MSVENDEESKENGVERNLGVQPIDIIMAEREMANHELLAASSEPMTHKAVQRARKGRRLTKHMQRRMVVAFNTVLKQRGAEDVFTLEQLFNYKA